MHTKGSILVVDDELSVLEIVSGILRSAGYFVLEASSGPEALDISAEQLSKIDVLLTDLIMPGMTGRMLADILKTRCAGLEVIFMSGYIDDSRTKAMMQGLNFIPKPVDWGRLKSMIREIMKHKNQTA